MAASLHNVLRVIGFTTKKEDTTITPRFSYIDASDITEVYAVDTDDRSYLLLWFDAEDMNERSARCVAMPIIERFWMDKNSIPVEYLDAWTGKAEEWSKK